MNETIATMDRALDELVAILTTYGLGVLGALVILIIGLWLANKAHDLTARALSRTAWVEAILIGFLSNLVKYLVLIFTILAVLSQFGIQTASLLTVLGAAGLAIGLAMQGTLSNIAAGVMLLIFRPFRVGDVIEVAGQTGSVKLLNLFFTEMASADNVKIVVPNAQIWGAALKNYSSNPTRRIEMSIGLPYGTDIDKAMAAIVAVAAADDQVLKAPAPSVTVSGLGGKTVTVLLQAWVNVSDAGSVKSGLHQSLKAELDKAGVEIL